MKSRFNTPHNCKILGTMLPSQISVQTIILLVYLQIICLNLSWNINIHINVSVLFYFSSDLYNVYSTFKVIIHLIL